MALLSEASLITRYFGTIAAASTRTLPAARMAAALTGSLFRAPNPTPTPGNISISEALELLHQDHVVFVDTREAAEVASTGCVPGAVRIPRNMLLLRSQNLNQEGAHLVAYGATDTKSMQAGQMLRSLGFKDVSAMSSYHAWVESGAPVQGLPAHNIGRPAAAQI